MAKPGSIRLIGDCTLFEQLLESQLERLHATLQLGELGGIAIRLVRPQQPLNRSMEFGHVALQSPSLVSKLVDPIGGLQSRLPNRFTDDRRIVTNASDLFEHKSLDLMGGQRLPGTVVPAAFRGVVADVVAIAFVLLGGVRG